ncbi:MAG: ATP-grasp domain-containing protein [Mesorhizobium sp.]|uniref:ATP-grasp domain-containing protein n=1 Tax=Mesorhizobium sp. TaxID=1871066 RepID=UPI00120B533C|nr:acetyl-CoA carboxylase biotin carboxylase subunit family protein [Mesorhizobium sp.]TIT04454.1 MAG: ATP-grasp domain-containing protein [Mesorhizobium sp.]TKD46944.1 MAG: ATP-grasp domain-containing protein [Mesorhizobium sp.]
MARRALILLEGTRSNGPLYVKAARRLGLNPITLSVDPTRYQYIQAERSDAIRVDTDNLDAVIRECSRLHEIYDIAGITSALEASYATVGKLCRYFDLPGPNPASIERCCDKFTQRQLLAEAGVPIPAYRLAANASETEGSAAEIGLPVILKPAVGGGSIGVRLCRNVEEVAEHTIYLLGEKHLWQSSPRILVEEFAQGPLYVANLMGNEVIGITAYEFGPAPHFVVRESTCPAPLTDVNYKRIADVSLSCLQALELGWGPTCIELRLTPGGPVVIEVNPRLGGGEPKLVRLAYSIDLVTEHIKLVIGENWNLRRRHSHSAVWRNLVPDCDGTLDWIYGDGLAATVPGVAEVKLYVESKRPIIRKGDYRDSLGYVIAVSPSVAETNAILQRAVDLIHWSITPFGPLVETLSGC